MKLPSVCLATVIACIKLVAKDAPEDVFPVSVTGPLWSENDAFSPGIASNDDDYLVVWSLGRTNESGLLMAARLNADGLVRERFVIAEDLADSGPAVTACAGNYVVVWRKGEGIYRRTVRATGELEPIRVVNPAWADGRITIAGNQTGFLIAWVERVPDQDFTTIQIADFEADEHHWGQFLANDDTLRAGMRRTDWPALGASSGNFLIVWNESGPTQERRRKSLRCNTHRPNGGVKGGSLAITGRAREASEQHSPVVTWNAGNYLVAWTDYRQKNGHGDVFAGLLAANGEVRRIIPIAVGKNGQTEPGSVPFNDGFFVTWSEAHSSGGVALRGRFILPDARREADLPRAATLWSDLGESGYSVSASHSKGTIIAILQSGSPDASYSIRAIRIQPTR